MRSNPRDAELKFSGKLVEPVDIFTKPLAISLEVRTFICTQKKHVHIKKGANNELAGKGGGDE